MGKSSTQQERWFREPDLGITVLVIKGKCPGHYRNIMPVIWSGFSVDWSVDYNRRDLVLYHHTRLSVVITISGPVVSCLMYTMCLFLIIFIYEKWFIVQIEPIRGLDLDCIKLTCDLRCSINSEKMGHF